MSEELQHLLNKFLYHLAVEQGVNEYGESADDLFRRAANELAKLPVMKELPELMDKKLSELASDFE